MRRDITRNFRYILALATAFWLIAVAGATADPAARVDVFAGTRPGPHTYGAGHNYPGATVPFGMVQWSPDTTPAIPYGGLYDWRRHHISGFSLTHVSGAGCALYGDLPFVPTTEALTTSPTPRPGPGLAGQFEPGFSHRNESGAPGFYSVELQPKPLRRQVWRIPRRRSRVRDRRFRDRPVRGARGRRRRERRRARRERRCRDL
jgi:putative alpha-1,2-mannosidase